MDSVMAAVAAGVPTIGPDCIVKIEHGVVEPRSLLLDNVAWWEPQGYFGMMLAVAAGLFLSGS